MRDSNVTGQARDCKRVVCLLVGVISAIAFVFRISLSFANLGCQVVEMYIDEAFFLPICT